jgi:hypothetical protein
VTIVLVDTSALAKTVIEEPESPASSTAEGLLVVSPR